MEHDLCVGSISWGTLRTEDVIESFLSFLSNADKEKYDKVLREDVWMQRAYEDGYMTLAVESDEEEASMFLHEVLWPAMEEIAPEGTYFGAHPGDGSDFGYWPIELID